MLALRVRVGALEAGESLPADKGDLTPRQRLADGLTKCRTLQGKTKGEVRALLGKPLPEAPIDYQPNIWNYEIGPERGFSLDTELFSVYFRSGRVRRVEIGST